MAGVIIVGSVRIRSCTSYTMSFTPVINIYSTVGDIGDGVGDEDGGDGGGDEDGGDDNWNWDWDWDWFPCIFNIKKRGYYYIYT